MAPPFNQLIPHLYGSRPQIPDLELCVYVGAVNKCGVVCGSDLQREHSGDEWLSSSILLKYESSMGSLFVLRWTRVRLVSLGSGVQ